MYKTKKIAVVIPAYNVEQQIKQVIECIPDFVDQIVVVDDCSRDRTAQALATVNDPRLIRAENSRNLGVGGAMKTGFRIALQCNADITVKIDGDGQMDPGLIPQLIEPLIRFSVDYVKGNRLLHRLNRQSMPWLRLCGNLGMSFLNKLASGYWHVFDPQNGYVAIRRSALAEIDLDRIDDSYFFENSMLTQLNCLDALVLDIPTGSLYRENTSHMSIRRVLLQFPLKLFSGFCYRVWCKHLSRDLTPVGVLWLSGLPLFSFGCIFSFYHWFHSAFAGAYTSAGTVMIGALSIILGFQLLLQGTLLDVSWSPRLSPTEQAAVRRWIRELQNDTMPSGLTKNSQSLDSTRDAVPSGESRSDWRPMKNIDELQASDG